MPALTNLAFAVIGCGLLVGGIIGLAQPRQFVGWFPQGRPFTGSWLQRLDVLVVACLWIITGVACLVGAWMA